MPKINIKLDDKYIKPFRDIGNHLRYENRFSLPEKLENIVSKFCSTYIANKRTISKGTVFYRSRIHEFQQNEPYSRESMGAPPKGKSSSGRINPVGIPYLYCSTEKETAVSEVRPWKGALLSVGKFKTVRDIQIVDLSKRNAVLLALGFKEKEIASEKKLGIALVSSILTAHYFSQPTHNDDEYGYLVSQYISEKIKLFGIDGIIYQSVLNSAGKNICLFSPSDAICGLVEVVKISEVSYDFIKK